MPEPSALKAPAAAAPAAPATPQDDRERPLLLRLSLVVFVLIGLAGLQQLDRLLVREYRNDAVAQAAQTDALLESFVRYRVALLRTLAALVGDADLRAEGARRFALVAREITTSSPELLTIFRLDTLGVVRDVYPRTMAERALLGVDHSLAPDRAEAFARAGRSRSAASTGSVPLSAADRGFIAYYPIVHSDTLVGFIGGAFTYRTLFSSALAGHFQGQFAYHVRDEAGRVIAASSGYPERVSRLVEREVRLPDGQRWSLAVAVPPFQPLIARLITWSVGILLIALVVLLVVREAARAQRFAVHSRNLERLSRDLLDANVRLEDRAQQVVEANRAKSRFLANVSHELRTPLNAILGYNALALDGLYGSVSEPLRKAHERIRAAGAHLLTLVDDILDLSKIEAGRMEIVAEPVDVAAMLDSVATVVEPSAAAKSVRLNWTTAADLPQMTTDPRHLRQILLNLAANAIKFTERGSVTLSARPAGTHPATRVAISVEDTGIGIPDGDRERIFDEFEQVRPDGRGDSQRRGTGLGLTISRKLARLLGGDVTVESRIGAGSRFTLTVPTVTLPRDAGADTPAFAHRALRSDVEREIARGHDGGPPTRDTDGSRTRAETHETGGGISLDDTHRPG